MFIISNISKILLAQGEKDKLATVILGLAVIILACFLVLEMFRLKKQKEKNTEAENWHKIAFTDDLTGLSNRMAYSEHIRQIKTNKSSWSNIAVILFDIDNFKQINDTKGHLEGDRILKECAEMLQEIFKYSGSCVYRIGGDEFAVVLENVCEEYIINALLNIKKYEESHQSFRVSKGYSQTVEEDFDKMFEQADEMLYADKNSKK